MPTRTCRRQGDLAMTPTSLCVGGVDESVASLCHVIRFVDKDDIDKCKDGTVLVGSISRNRRFDGERADNGECSITIQWPNESREKWRFYGNECVRYTGIRAGKRIRGVTGRGGLTLDNYSLMSGSPLSMSLSVIPRNLENTEKQTVFDSIRGNLGLPPSTPALCFKSPSTFFKRLTWALSDHLCLAQCLVILSGPIRYRDRTIRVNSFREFKDTVDTIFHSGALNMDRVFLKPRIPYEKDREYRLMWIAHSGATPKHVEFPLTTDYQVNDHVVLDGFALDDHFSIAEDASQLV